MRPQATRIRAAQPRFRRPSHRRIATWAAACLAALAASLGVAGTASADPPTDAPTGVTISSTTPHVGDTLDASNAWTSTETDPTITVTYQWEDCDGSGANCTDATGTGATTSSYTVVAADSGHTIVVVETATDSASDTASDQSAPTSVVPPVSTGAPSLSGVPQEGQTLTLTPGTWSGASAISDEWESCNGATCNGVQSGGTTYTIQPSDAGNSIKVTETASNPGGAVSVDSNSIGPVVPPPTNLSPPAITGIAQQTQTLHLTQGTWSDPSAARSDVWNRCDGAGLNCVPVQNGGSTYTLTSQDVGYTIVVSETASGAGGTGGPVNSQPTSVVVIASGTTLFVVPGAAVTNQTVNLIAVVSSLNGSPAGVVTFENHGAPIAGCATVPAAASGQNLSEATCQASFAAASPVQLTAVFTPAHGSSFVGSSSNAHALPVARDPTSTSLALSNPTITPGSTTTYTATITPNHAGPARPTGTVAFFDGGTPIAACAHQPLNGALTATCTVSYGSAGTHGISARYGGDGNFAGSGSAVSTETVNAPPIAGTIHATMQWTFMFTRTYTKIVALVINGAPTGAKLVITCHGRGCPFGRQATTITKPRRCKRHCSGRRPGTIDLAARFHQRHLRVGAQITVQITRPSWIGKYYRFTIRAHRGPRIQISCLAPGSSRPGVGC